MEFFEFKHTVISSEIDYLNHVNNVVYLEWVQRAADKHWSFLTRNEKDFPYMWFIIRHEIDYLQQAVLGDVVTIRTWVGKTAGVKSVRHVHILKEEKVLAKAETTFCLLDKKGRRPVRITESVLNLLNPVK